MLDISEVSKRCGQSPSALRYYEERGLIQSVGRSGRKRTFDSSVLERLALLALGRAAGFSLDEIAEMFEGSEGTSIDRGALLVKADELDKKFQKLIVIRDGLRHTAACPAPSRARGALHPALAMGVGFPWNQSDRGLERRLYQHV